MRYKNYESNIFVSGVQGGRLLEGVGRVKPLEATGRVEAQGQ